MSAPLMQADDVVVAFPAGRRTLRALNGVSLTVRHGETLGLVGESGSGKSTFGRAILGLEPVTSGAIVVGGIRVTDGRRAELAKLRRATAMVFQDPVDALNPRLTAGEAIAEVLSVHRIVPRAEIPARVEELLRLVGLDPGLAGRRPHALSGGQAQRVGIARALAVEPKLIVADECVAALDVSIQGQIINLFLDLKDRMALTLVFIAHDLAIVRRLSDRVAVMYLGRIVEEGETEAVFTAPRHPYTAALIAAIPEIDPDVRLPEAPVQGEAPSPLDLPPGCPFHPRCPHAMPACREGLPPALRRRDDHAWACILEPGQLPRPATTQGAHP